MEKEKNQQEELPDCCKPNLDKDNKKKGIIQGIIYGTIPHIGCIMFIIASVLGATILMQYFRPLLMNRYIFHYLIGISFIFATISSFLYLRKNKRLSWKGIKSKKKYLSIMYGSTIGINLILFLFIFPLVANIGGVDASQITGSAILEISVDIPCPGHAPLITSELKTINGVKGSEYSFPNDFEVYYNPELTSEQEILSLEVFDEYSATIIGQDNQIKQTTARTSASSGGTCGGGCGGTSSCGGSCGSPTCSYNR
tara:strand:+ start:4628 stop:5392 length:765 start_codon:yes stop_codon:yes gene_type:complete